MRVLVVRHLRVSGDHPAMIDYVVVENGSYLVYSENFDMLYACDVEEFESEHEMEAT